MIAVQKLLILSFYVFEIFIIVLKYTNTKPGGLDVETNRDRDRERPSCRD